MSATTSLPTRREFLGIATMMAGAAVALQVEAVGATPSSGTINRDELAEGQISEQVDVSTNGPSDFYVQHVTLEAGAASGWHTHPGSELSVVKAGSVIFYDGPDCEPRRYQAGEGFFVPAGTTHLARNEDTAPAELYVTFLVSAGVAPRTDARQPADCAR